MLAGSCRRLQASLAARAMEALDSGEAQGNSGPPTLLSAAETASSARRPFSIVLPQGLSEMQLA